MTEQSDYYARMALVDQIEKSVLEQLNRIQRLRHSLMKEQQMLLDETYADIKFNLNETASLHLRVQKARKAEETQFEWGGSTFLTDYAQFLVQMLCSQMGLREMPGNEKRPARLVDQYGQIVYPRSAHMNGSTEEPN